MATRRIGFTPRSFLGPEVAEIEARVHRAAGRHGISVATIDLHEARTDWSRFPALLAAIAAGRPQSIRFIRAEVMHVEWDGGGNYVGHQLEPRGDDIPGAFLRAPPGLDRMASLAISDSGLTARGLAALVEAEASLLRVVHLDLSGNALDAAAVALLSASRLGQRLASLSLARNPIGDPGAEALASSAPPLESVDLSACGLGERAADALANSPGLVRSLRVLRLTDNGFGDAERKRLHDRYGSRLKC